MIDINLNIIKKDNEEYLYKEDDLYLEFNNAGHHSITQINCIYNYYILYLKLKAINNFFFKAVIKPIKKVYTKEEIKYQIFTTRTAIYKTFILSSKYPPIYIKEKAILKGY